MIYHLYVPDFFTNDYYIRAKVNVEYLPIEKKLAVSKISGHIDKWFDSFRGTAYYDLNLDMKDGLLPRFGYINSAITMKLNQIICDALDMTFPMITVASFSPNRKLGNPFFHEKTSAKLMADKLMEYLNEMSLRQMKGLQSVVGGSI